MAAADHDVPVLRNDRVDGPDHLAGISTPGAMSNAIASAGSVAMRCASSFERSSPPSVGGRPASGQAGQDGLDADAGTDLT